MGCFHLEKLLLPALWKGGQLSSSHEEKVAKWYGCHNISVAVKGNASLPSHLEKTVGPLDVLFSKQRSSKFREDGGKASAAINLGTGASWMGQILKYVEQLAPEVFLAPSEVGGVFQIDLDLLGQLIILGRRSGKHDDDDAGERDL
ncbi:hypothetical protein CEXT_716151 [Caerostris extrusa]|uniref:Uncharacterized protein n=1 Tax=Caerostris extrusa TaxID=172846 RepID=A0AAV4PTQ7_CAEEX|nr:hypothetical protein CEXT_716151 [Caerostris extrusa]